MWLASTLNSSVKAFACRLRMVLVLPRGKTFPKQRGKIPTGAVRKQETSSALKGNARLLVINILEALLLDSHTCIPSGLNRCPK